MRTTTKYFELLTENQISTIDKKTTFLLPIGSLEPHYHLPFGTDSYIAEGILKLLNEEDIKTILLPVIPVGYLFKLKEWQGSIGINFDSYSGIIEGICNSISTLGFNSIFIMSGHDENREPTIKALHRCCEKFSIKTVYCDWIDLAISKVREISTSKTEGHASEIQTSVFKYLYPDIKINENISFENGDNLSKCDSIGADDLFASEESGYWIKKYDKNHTNSFTGNPKHASTEKGEIIVTYIINRAKLIINKLQK